MENKTLDLLSKLLASENITIIRDRVPTASFDVINRVLRLPILLNLTAEEETMLAFHEVSHALFTGDDYVKFIEKEKNTRRTFHHYMNVVEDVRVERLFKEKYPGARKDFFSGYKALNARDFFKLENRKINEMCLIDRINVFYKVGFSAGVKFNAEERAFISRIDACETVNDVYDVALAIYTYAAQQEKQRKELEIQIPQEVEDEYDFSDETEDGYGDPTDDEEYDEEGNPINSEASDSESEDDLGELVDKIAEEIMEVTSDPELAEEQKEEEVKEQAAPEAIPSRVIGNQEIDEAPESETQEAFDDNVQKNVQIAGRPVAYYMMEGSHPSKIIDHRTIVKDARVITAEWAHIQVDHYSKFRQESTKMVGHLVKEFEMRKAASRYSRTQVARTGELSMNKISKFKVSNDLFKKLDIVADDKNHGFMMLLDWSGSMQPHMQDTIGQVITLASFCRRVNIPFTVYAFSDNLTKHFGFNPYNVYNPIRTPKDGNGIIETSTILMFNFFNNKMSNMEFETVAKFLYNRLYGRRLNKDNSFSEAPYALNGTPLTSALMFVDEHIENFKRANNVEKMTLITLTDGEGNSSHVINTNGRLISPWDNSEKRFLRHPRTNRVIPLEGEKLENSLLRMIKENDPTLRIIGFFVTDFSSRSISNYVFRNNLPINGVRDFSKKVAVEGRREGFYEFPVPSYNRMFFIKDSAAAMDIKFDDIDDKMNANQIAKRFAGVMNSATKGRVVLTKFIEQIA